MLKALLKKQMLELNSFLFQNRKTGKRRSRGSATVTIILYAALFLFLGFAFWAIANPLCAQLVPIGLDWLYFVLMGMIALALGVFGSVFNTYAGLYHAKDNEMLLSLPIPPGRILLARMISVYLMGLFYEALVLIPAILAYGMQVRPGALTLVMDAADVLLVGFVILALSCFLGWIVALIAARLKNKSFLTVLLTLVFLAAYYFVYFRANEMIAGIVADSERVSAALRQKVYPVYAFGMGAVGSAVHFLTFAVIALALFALTYWIMARSFLHIVTANRGEKKEVYRETGATQRSMERALLYKELRRFTQSPTYMLNAGLGAILMPVAAVFLLIKAKDFPVVMELFGEALPIVLAAVLCMMCSTIMITAPSVSLEGKNLWVLRSLPIPAGKVLQAKLTLHQMIALPAVLIACAAIEVAARFDASVFLCILLEAAAFSRLIADAGLAADLKMPNFTWTNETIPIKQGAPAAISLFGGWLLTAALGIGGYFLSRQISALSVMLIEIVLLVTAERLLRRWLIEKGTKIWDTLG